MGTEDAVKATQPDEQVTAWEWYARERQEMWYPSLKELRARSTFDRGIELEYGHTYDQPDDPAVTIMLHTDDAYRLGRWLMVQAQARYAGESQWEPFDGARQVAYRPFALYMRLRDACAQLREVLKEFDAIHYSLRRLGEKQPLGEVVEMGVLQRHLRDAFIESAASIASMARLFHRSYDITVWPMKYLQEWLVQHNEALWSYGHFVLKHDDPEEFRRIWESGDYTLKEPRIIDE